MSSCKQCAAWMVRLTVFVTLIVPLMPTLLTANSAWADEELPLLTSLRDPKEIARTLEKLPATDQDRLQRLQTQFQKLSVDEQRRMRELHRSLWESPEGDRLYGVLERYRDWLSTLSAGQRDDLLALPISKRVSAINKLKTELDADRFAQQAEGLTKSDATAVRHWLMNYFALHQDVILQHVPKELEDRIRSTESKERRLRMITMAAARHRLFRDLPPPRPDDFAELMGDLSESARQYLESADGGPERLAIVRNWIETSLQSRFQSYKVTQQQLEEFYVNGLSLEEQESLDSLPANELQAALERMFRERHRHRPPPPLGPRSNRSKREGPPRDGSRGDEAGPGGPRDGRRGDRPPSRDRPSRPRP